MINTKLILIEGPPGSGKSTTTQKLAAEISNYGHACQCFYEWSEDHPIPIGDDFHLGQVISTAIERENEVLQYWQKFIQSRIKDDLMTIIESRFWQTSVMLMYIAGHPVESVIESNQRVIEVIQPLKPVMVYFSIDNLSEFVERTIRLKTKEWQQTNHPGSWEQHIYDAFESQKWFTDRRVSGLQGMVMLLEEWAVITEKLYQQLPFPKVKIKNPHQDWSQTMAQIRKFIEM